MLTTCVNFLTVRVITLLDTRYLSNIQVST